MKAKTSRRNPGDRACWYIGNLTLCDDYAGQRFDLRPFQSDIIRRIFGTLRPDGLRQYRTVFLGLPRKQAKTQLSAGIGTFCLTDPLAKGREIICAAGDREQASHLFDKTAEMIGADPALEKRVRIYSSTRKIATRVGNNVLKVVSADGRRQHGLNPSHLLFDELHTQPDRKLYEALTTAQGARREPLTILITTAGNRRDSLCYEKWQYAIKCRDDPTHDPTWLPIIYAADPEDDWTDEAVWHKAMPALGDFVSIDVIRAKLAEARDSAAEESSFRQLFLNQWVASSEKWLNRARWDRCGETLFKPAGCEGLECFGGLDLANTEDTCAFVLCFPMADGTYRFLCWFWMPEERARERDRKEGSRRFENWARKGLIRLTPGATVDYEEIEETIVDLAADYKIRDIRIDKFSATRTAVKLIAAGLPAQFMRQGTLSMNEPLRYLEVMLARDRIRHNAHPVLSWMADNAVSEKDSEGNIKLAKGLSADKIDGMVSMVMALSGAISVDPGEEQDLIVI